MFLVIFTLAIIVATHFLGIFTTYPISLTVAHCNEYWPTYIYGDFVHMNYYHLIIDSAAFILIYCLSPIDNIWRSVKYASSYLLVFLVANAAINWFVLSPHYPDGPVNVYYGISAAEFTMIFMVAILWLFRSFLVGCGVLLIATVLVLSPFILDNLGSTSALLAKAFDFINMEKSLGHVAVDAHLFGALLSLPAAFLMKIFRRL